MHSVYKYPNSRGFTVYDSEPFELDETIVPTTRGATRETTLKKIPKAGVRQRKTAPLNSMDERRGMGVETTDPKDRAKRQIFYSPLHDEPLTQMSPSEREQKIG